MSPSILNYNFVKKSILGWKLFLLFCFVLLIFCTLNISCHCFLAGKVSADKSSESLMGVPLYVTHCFSLDAFKILSLALT